MKKLFLSLAAVLMALATNAAVISINNGTADALRVALNGAADGDTIEMAAGTYVESNSNYIAFAGKEVTVQAAEGAVVLIQPQVPITISEGGKAILKNIKIDASRLTELASWYEHVIYPSDANENNRLEMDGCELYGFNLNKSAIYCSSSNKLASAVINNCYFHNNRKSCMFFENTDMATLTITNSTFANTYLDEGDASSYYAGNIDSRSTVATILIDHCTFYNIQLMNTDYAAIGKIKVTDASMAVASNCIFALPTAGSYRAIRDKVTANNCLVYNYTSDSNWGMQSAVVKNNCIKEQDPLFADAANGDYTLGDGSPALDAGTDGSNLGDPRWWPAATPAGCNWDAIEFLGTTDATYANQFKLCQADGEHPGVVNIQQPGFATEIGIYVTFPSAAFGTISLDASQYDVQGAGMILHLSAFTALETEVSVVCESKEYIFTVYNAKGVATAIENNAVVEKAVKFIENGQLFIIKNGVRYNTTGAVVR